MPKRSLLAIVISMLTLTSLAVTSAVADTKSVSDPEGDSRRLDVAEASHDHYLRADGAWRLRHSIRTHDEWRSRLLKGGRELTVYVRRTHRSIVIYFKRGLKSKVYITNPETHKRRTVGRPPVWREDDRTVVVSLKRGLLGRVRDGYGWFVGSSWYPECTDDNAACPGYVDRAPDEGYIRHNL